MMKWTTYLALVFLVALFIGGCASIKKRKDDQRQPRAQVVGTRAEADLEESANMKKGGKKGQVRLRCTTEPTTGSRIRRKRCRFKSAADEERRETQDQFMRYNNRPNRYDVPVPPPGG